MRFVRVAEVLEQLSIQKAPGTQALLLDSTIFLQGQAFHNQIHWLMIWEYLLVSMSLQTIVPARSAEP